jgi:hypothetical protein
VIEEGTEEGRGADDRRERREEEERRGEGLRA